MGQITGGERQKPRVALLGLFKSNELESLKYVFPTVYIAENLDKLEKQVDSRDIDLLIIGENITDLNYSWKENCHIICFSQYMESLPGPTKTTELHLGKQAKTEAYIISDLSLLMGRISKTDFANLNGIRGWIILELVKYSPYTTSIDLAEAKNLLSKNYGNYILDKPIFSCYSLSITKRGYYESRVYAD